LLPKSYFLFFSFFYACIAPLGYRSLIQIIPSSWHNPLLFFETRTPSKLPRFSGLRPPNHIQSFSYSALFTLSAAPKPLRLDSWRHTGRNSSLLVSKRFRLLKVFCGFPCPTKTVAKFWIPPKALHLSYPPSRIFILLREDGAVPVFPLPDFSIWVVLPPLLLSP